VKHLLPRLVVAGLLALLAVDPAVTLADWEPPPPPKPQRRTAGEGAPPLPLPVTPMRRTEKKRPPAPPALIAKLQYGKLIWVTTEDGRRFSYYDWQNDRTDLHYLLRFACPKLGVRYRHVELPMSKFAFDPASIPAIYITGHHDFKWSPDEQKKLYAFVRDGGFIIGDACCGNTTFAQAFVREVAKVFPARPLQQLPPDHPLYRTFYQINGVELREPGKTVPHALPPVRGLHMGCRLAVVLFEWDVSCGWARHEHANARRIAPAHANRLGTNLIAYMLAYYQLGRFLSTEKVYHQETEPARDEFIFGQVIHGGDWDPAPSAAAGLLKYLAANSTMQVKFRRAAVDLRTVDAFRYPVLYVTGHNDFKLTEPEVFALRSYLRNGGTLIADACCGREAFDTAFRRELKRVLPQQDLHALAADHPAYSSLVPISTVQYSGALQKAKPGLAAPSLEGVSLNNVTAVIYSRYGLGACWDGQERPFALSYSSKDALKLGANVFVYAMTH